MNSARVWPPSGRPYLSGVKFREMMFGPAYPFGPVGVPTAPKLAPPFR